MKNKNLIIIIEKCINVILEKNTTWGIRILASIIFILLLSSHLIIEAFNNPEACKLLSVYFGACLMHQFLPTVLILTLFFIFILAIASDNNRRIDYEKNVKNWRDK